MKADDRAPVEFPPGASPFQVKGTLWMGFRMYADAHATGGSSELARSLPPALQTFLEQLFVAAGWYDLFPMLAISRALASRRGLTHMQQVQHTATWHGQQDLKGMYKTLLKQASPQAVCRRFASIYSQLYNFGRVEVLREESNLVEACAYGVPEPLAEWWMKATDSYLRPILASTGAKQPKMIWTGFAPDGHSHGVRLVRVPSQTVWG